MVGYKCMSDYNFGTNTFLNTTASKSEKGFELIVRLVFSSHFSMSPSSDITKVHRVAPALDRLYLLQQPVARCHFFMILYRSLFFM